MPSMTFRPISGTGTSWSNIANAYDANGTSTVSTVELKSYNYSNRVGTFNFDLSSFPSNAKMTEATLTVNAKASANSRITLYGDIDGDSSKRIINSSLTTTQTDYTADVTNYISNWIPSSEDDTSTTTSLAYGPPSKYLTLCNGIKMGDGYWTNEDSYVTTEFIDITNVKSMSFSFSGYDDRELSLYAWYLSKDTSAIDETHASSTLSQSDLESYRSQGYKYACAIVEAQYPYNATPYSGEVLVNFTYLNNVTNTGWVYSSYPGVSEFEWDSDYGEKTGTSDNIKSTEKWIVADLFPNNSTTVEFYIYNNYDNSLPGTIYYDYWNSSGRYSGYKTISSTSGTENGRSYKKITFDKTTIQNYKYIGLDFNSDSDERDFEIVVKTGAAVGQTSGGSSTNGGTLKLTGYMTSTNSTTLSIYDIVLNIEYTTCETKLGNTSINSIYLGQTEIAKVYLGTTLVYQKSSSSSGDSGSSAGGTQQVSAPIDFVCWYNGQLIDDDQSITTTTQYKISELFTSDVDYITVEYVGSETPDYFNIDCFDSNKEHKFYNDVVTTTPGDGEIKVTSKTSTGYTLKLSDLQNDSDYSPYISSGYITFGVYYEGYFSGNISDYSFKITKHFYQTSGDNGDNGNSGVSEEVLTLHQGAPEPNRSTYDGAEDIVTTSPIDITNLKSLTVTITQTNDDTVYFMYVNEYDENKLFIGDNYIENGQAELLKSYTLSESDLNGYRMLDKYLSFTIDSNTHWELYTSTLTVTAYYTYY